MSDLELLAAKASEAEAKLAAVQAELTQLKLKMKNRLVNNGETEDLKEEKEISNEKKSVKKQGSEAKIELPFKLIEDEAILISEKGKNATMCVTVCNGESNPPFISAKGINWLKNNFDSNDKDVFVDTYAKCGTTLCIKKVYQMFQAIGRQCDGASHEDMSDPWNAVPWIEVDVSQELATTNSNKPNKFLNYIKESNKKSNNVRIWKSHAPWVNLPVNKIGKGTKIIHVTRNPKDVICSYFNFFQKEPFVQYKGDFNTLFDWFCDGSVVHSNFWDFELAWYRAAQKNPSQILWITFEEIVRIPDVAIQKTAKFLNIALTEDQIDHIVDQISFDKMKKAAMKKSGKMGAVLMNKGTIGRWKTILTDAQSARMDRISNARFAGTDIEFDYGVDEEAAKIFYQKISSTVLGNSQN